MRIMRRMLLVAGKEKYKFMCETKHKEVAVSVICNTYNHGPYIKDALEGFVSQKTNFNYEVLIHDDASTDNTADIIREYERKYPELIKPIYQKENQYSKGVNITSTFHLPRLKGRYVALCEGDDYWTDSGKLQRQFDAMEAHPELDICAHTVSKVQASNSQFLCNIAPSDKETVFSTEEVIAGGGGFVATNSLFYRRELLENQPEFLKYCPLDYSLQIHGALRGGMLYLPDNMAIYRFLVAGSWTRRIENKEYADAQRYIIKRMLDIGKMYSSADLAYYNQGDKFPSVIVNNINTSIDSVLLPTMASVQDDRNHVKSMTRRAIKTSTYIMAPLMMGLAFCAEPIVRLVLTDKWLPCVPFLRIFCITYMFYPIHTANLNAIKAMGRSDLFLKLEIAKKIVGIALLLSTMWFGVMAMAYSLLVSSVTSQIINSWPNRKLLNYRYLDQLKDILPGIALAIFMGCCVNLVGLLHLSNTVTLLIQIPMGAAIYIGASAALHLESYEYLMGMIRPVLKKIARK